MYKAELARHSEALVAERPAGVALFAQHPNPDEVVDGARQRGVPARQPAFERIGLPVACAQRNDVADVHVDVADAGVAAAEEQGSATSEIAGNIQQAASSAKQVSGSVITAQGAASQTGTIADNVLGAAGRLSVEAERLKTEVAGFLAQVRAA